MAFDITNLDALNVAIDLDPQVRTLTGLISVLFTVALSLAGIILLGLIILSGFTILTGANSPDQVERGKKMLTQSLVGFIIVVSAYWLAQILEVLFNFPIVSL